MKFSFVTIIYNPKSFGKTGRLAHELYTDIQDKLPHVGVEVVPTKYAGHASDIVEITGRTRRNVVVVVIGGDGTYNEAVNGAMKVPVRNRPIMFPFAGGNANDHARELPGDAEIMSRLLDPKPHAIDIFKVSVHNPVGEDTIRYAHSYVGFGSSGRVARMLNEYRVGRVAEKLFVVAELLRPRQFDIIADGRMKYLYSLICSNVGVMAKFLKLTDDAHLSDGKFEVVETPAVSKTKLLREVAQSAAGISPKPKKVKSYSFLLMSSVQAQFDGEPMWLPRGASVSVSMAEKSIKTLV